MRNRNLNRLSSQSKISPESDFLEKEYKNDYFQTIIPTFSSSILFMGYHPNNQLSLIRWLSLKHYVVTYTYLEKCIKTKFNNDASFTQPIAKGQYTNIKR